MIAAPLFAETMQRRTRAGFLVAVALLALVSLTATLAVREYRESAEWLTHSFEVIAELEGLSAALSDGDSASRGFLSSGDASYLAERDGAISQQRSHLETLRRLSQDDVGERQSLAALEERIAAPSVFAEDLEALTPEERPKAGQAIHDATRRAVADIGALKDFERGRLAARARAGDRWSDILVGTFAALLLTVCALLAWVFTRIRAELSQRFQQSEALSTANAGLEAANRELESFSYSVSHDLRSPLRAIDGYAQMLEEDFAALLDETGRRYIRTIRNGSQRMATLIDDLLTFSRLSRQSLSLQRIDMTALARRVAAEVVDAQTERRVPVRVEELPPAEGDPALLRQVWTNLLSNAVKYTSKASTPDVRVRGTSDGARVRYEVIDNGVGFDMKYSDKLFGVFQRLHPLEEYPGTGVGLAIVQRIVLRHHGAVSAHGERDKGATFGFTLPVRT